MAQLASNNFSLLNGDDDWEQSSASKKKNKRNKKKQAAAEAAPAVVAPPAASQPVVHAGASTSSSVGNGFTPVVKKHFKAHGEHSRPLANNAPVASSSGNGNNGASTRTAENMLDAVSVVEQLARNTTDEAGCVRLWRDWGRQVRARTEANASPPRPISCRLKKSTLHVVMCIV